MRQYQDFLRHILKRGKPKDDRTGTGTISVFGYQMRFDLSGPEFPLLTTKSVHFKSVVGELLWFLSGNTNANELRDKYGVTIWDEWADSQGNLGPVYGKQWRNWPVPEKAATLTTGDSLYMLGAIDQITQVIEAIKSNPNDRGHIVSAWNVGELRAMALRPCHALFQFDVTDGVLSCQLYQRSADAFLGVPFNIASYALLTKMVAAQTGLKCGDFIWTGGDCHIYNNHREQVNLLLSREPKGLPTVILRPGVKSIFDYTPSDIHLIGYDPHPAIKATVAV